MTRVLLAIILALAVLAGGASLYARAEHARAGQATQVAKAANERAAGLDKALREAAAQADLLREIGRARQQELNRLREQAAATQKALNEALKANRDWADAPVPGSVLDALTAPADAAGEAQPGVAGAGARAEAGRPE